MGTTSTGGRKRIVCFHLFNDFSGSPKVLKGMLQSLLDEGYEIDLHTSRGGILDSLEGGKLRRKTYDYKFSSNPVATMVRYTFVQLLTFFKALGYFAGKDEVFYINTILPLGPAAAGKLLGKRIIYHYHENAFIKSAFYRFLANRMQKIADDIICVSDYQASFLKRKKGVAVIPNSIDAPLSARLRPDPESAFARKNILMLSSLKGYKGTREFIGLAEDLPHFVFTLVINAERSDIDCWLKEEKISLPPNVRLHSRANDVAAFYNQASIVVTLSNPQYFIETFGLTALEAMSCGLPVIVPTQGGIAEMVEDGISGYKINSLEKEKIKDKIKLLLTDREHYITLANNALNISKNYSGKKATEAFISILNHD